MEKSQDCFKPAEDGSARTLLSRCADDTERLGAELARELSVCSAPSVVALYGGLGAGKTAFARGFTRFFIPGAETHSPTYTIVNEYRGIKTTVYHFDMYRIGSADELYAVGFDDYLGRGHCVIEWAENIENELPDGVVRVKIERGASENERRVTISQHISS